MAGYRYQKVDGPVEEIESYSRPAPETNRKHRIVIIVQSVIIAILAVVVVRLVMAHPPSDPDSVNRIYSPAEKVLRYKNIVFRLGWAPDLTEYQGPPTAENNKAWEDLYQFGISKIPLSEARKLHNRTVPIPNFPGEYIVQLDVFHQLHCLNKIRQMLWALEDPKYRDDTDDTLNMEHMDHCVDALRQSLMCNPDITPLPYQWVDGRVGGQMTTTHTCADYDAIREWGLAHYLPRFDRTTRVHDPLDDE